MRNPVRQVSISGNSSRVEAASRALVAIVFLSALWFDPVQPIRDDLQGETLLAGFLVWSAVLMIIAWRSWWWDHQLARIAHVIDIAVFVVAVYYTEAPSTDFTSPFMAFAVLLLIKARVRWDWRATAATALVLLLLNVGVAATMASSGYPVDLQRVGRRVAYMVLLAVVLVWMGLERQVRLDLHFPLLPAQAASTTQVRDGSPLLEPMFITALGFAREAAGAGHAAIAWSAEQEPWTELGTSGAEPEAVHLTRLGPELLTHFAGGAEPGDDFDEAGVPHLAPDSAVLFCADQNRAMAFGPKGQRVAFTFHRPPPLAGHLRVRTGISVPITSDVGNGRLLLWDLADPCFDRLTLAQQAAEEIGRAFEREERARLAQAVAVNGAVTGVREAVARDLHDSAAQFLAGTMFRLEALRRQIGSGIDAGSDSVLASGLGTEIVAIKDAMRLEQAQLRELIGQLRRGETADRQVDLAQELTVLLGEVGAHWHLATTLDCGRAPILVPVTLSREVRQLVREAVANAARHGGGDALGIEIVGDGASLHLTITDNGRGFPAVEPGSKATLPRSIAERVAALGGSLVIEEAQPQGTRLAIRLPLQPISATMGAFDTTPRPDWTDAHA